MKRTDLANELAIHMYCDSYTQYGTCTPARWKQTSDEQRRAFIMQAESVIQFLEIKRCLTPLE